VETAAIEVRISAFNLHPLAAQLDVLVEERAGLEAATGIKEPKPSPLVAMGQGSSRAARELTY